MAFNATPDKSRPSSSRPSALVISETIPGSSEVESPSLSTPQARARFEFEPGKSNEGTKILMVEWEDDDSTQNTRGAWTISWEGKSTVLQAEEREDTKAEAQTHRMFFLLPPGVSIPTTVTLTLNAADKSKAAVVWKTNPLPAIFPPGFADSAMGGGRASKGVLHTLWAKKRLATLLKEIDAEVKNFPEGIGLEMALREKEWIEQTFSLGSNSDSTTSHRQALKGLGDATQSPSSPLSPGGSRLSEKLKGLKLQTGDSSLTPLDNSRNPLSPEAADIAVSSFSAFKGANPGALAAKPAQRPSEPPVQKKFVPQIPSRQSTGGSGVGSLAGMLAGTGNGFKPSSANHSDDNEEEEADLFALPLSPRSPEMTKSPFTFASGDTTKYLKGEHVQRVA